MQFVKKNKTLLLIFTRNIGLNTWIKNGSFSREVDIYNEYIKLKYFSKIYFLTFEPKPSQSELNSIENLINKKIKVIYTPNFFSKNKIFKFFYFCISPLIHFHITKKIDIVKTNQFDTVFPSLLLKFLFKKKIIYRGGYIHSEFFNIFYYRFIEKLGFNSFDRIIISSKYLKYKIIEKYNIEDKKINVLPNYINIKKFYDMKLQRKKKSFLYVGRINKHKNIKNLITACSELKLDLDLYGNNENYIESLNELIIQSNGRVKFFGKKDNSDLPFLYNQYEFFVLPSSIEGNPKVLLEAMACGCICLGTNVPGINDILTNNKNGFLSNGLGHNDLVLVLNKAINFLDSKNLKKNAQTYIKKNNQLSEYIKNEFEVLIN